MNTTTLHVVIRDKSTNLLDVREFEALILKDVYYLMEPKALFTQVIGCTRAIRKSDACFTRDEAIQEHSKVIVKVLEEGVIDHNQLIDDLAQLKRVANAQS